MKTSRYVVIGIAALASVLLAVLVRGMISGKGHNEAQASVEVAAPAPQPTARVLVATRNLPAGSRLSDGDLTWQDWPVNTLNPAYITDGSAPGGHEKAPAPGSEDAAAKSAVMSKTGDIVQKVADKLVSSPTKATYIGGVTRVDILANEPILDSKIVRSDEGGFMAVMLSPGMRALAVPVSVDNTAGGFILPGDHVDILVTHTAQANSNERESVQTVLRNIRVLAIDQQVTTDKDKPTAIGATATLEVRPQDGQVVTLAKASGTLSLMLRSYADAAGPSGAVVTNPVASASQSVKVYRNGQASEVMVSR